MTDPNQPNQPAQPNQPWQVPPSYQPPPPPRSGLPNWAIALIVVGALLVVLCVIGAIVSIGVLTVLGRPTSPVFSQIQSSVAEESPPPAPALPAELAIGESAELLELRMTVTDAHPLTGTRPPGSGKQYWAVEVMFENMSSDQMTLSVFSTAVEDATGQSYPYSLAAQRASPDPGFRVVESLKAGATASGTLFYELPQDADKLFWVYKNANGERAAIFRIK